MTEITERLSSALADRYRIERHLGAGGMANVYLAEDLKHKRKVAVKVLRPELAAVLGAERFVQEITTTANLQHPHILPLFDSGEADGFLYYVMPYIDGETLRDKLNRETQLGIDEAVRITTEVADALDYAHRHNVIHRDIKPENILLHDGRPMVADFGIALAVSAAAGGRMTETGLSLGTPHYMSPEQATAEKDLTNRSDIYSLGSVLYEMLTGEPPHTGASAQAIVMKIVTDEARPVTELRKSVPPHVAAATAKSLEKLAADRFGTAKAFADALANPAFTLPTTSPGHTGALLDRRWTRLSVLGWTVMVVLVVVSLWGWLRPPVGVLQPVGRFSVRFPEGELPQRLNVGPGFAWSPDGTRFLYQGDGGVWWLRERNQLRGATFTSVVGASMPVFSPDGRSIAFLAGHELRIAPVAGGQPTTLVELNPVGRPGALGLPTACEEGVCSTTLDWESDGYVYIQSFGGVSRIPEAGGELELVMPPNTSAGDSFNFWLDVLPNGRGALTVTGVPQGGTQLLPLRPNQTTVGIADFATGLVEPVIAGVYARYATSGHVVIVKLDGTVLAAPFDQEALAVTGDIVPILERVSVGSLGGPEFALSSRGDLIYRRRGAEAQVQQLVWVTRDGTVTEIDSGWTGNFENPRLSRNGARLAVSILARDENQTWIKELDRGPLKKITFAGSFNTRVGWTHDGESVTFHSNRGGNRDLYVRRADGTGQAQLLLDAEDNIDEAVFSADGEWLVYRSTGFQARNIYSVRVGADGAPVPLVATQFEELTPALSPDGRWLAYASDESGQREVYVAPFPNTNAGIWQISTQGGSEPVWAHSGLELFYKENGSLMSLRVLPGATFVEGERQVLFSLQGFYSMAFNQQYDVALDDQRFMMIQNSGASDAGELIVVENFFEELKEKVGNE